MLSGEHVCSSGGGWWASLGFHTRGTAFPSALNGEGSVHSSGLCCPGLWLHHVLGKSEHSDVRQITSPKPGQSLPTDSSSLQTSHSAPLVSVALLSSSRHEGKTVHNAPCAFPAPTSPWQHQL